MTPKEKAKELFEKYAFVEIAYYSSKYEVKQCALIAADEIIEFMSPMVNSKQAYDYWDDVKQEIKNL